MINNLKDLDKLIQLLQKRGVEKFKFDNIELQFDPSAFNIKTRQTSKKEVTGHAPGGITEETAVISDTLTEEQLLMWSVTSEAN